MLLVIDAGNTNIVFAIFKQDKLLGTWRTATDHKKTADEYAMILSFYLQQVKLTFKDIKAAIISNVVPPSAYAFNLLCKKYFNCKLYIVGEDEVKLNIKVKIDNPAEMGADRLVNAYAAFNQYKKSCIIIDFGTATTFDVITHQADYIGGVIAPGVNLSVEALGKAAAKLPQIDIKSTDRVIGKSTKEAMYSGIFYGYIGLVKEIIFQIKSEMDSKDDIKVISTGGLAALYSKYIEQIDHYEPDLTIYGLKDIFKLNNNK